MEKSKAKFYEKVLFYIVIFAFFQIAVKLIYQYMPSLTGLPRILFLALIFAIMSNYGKKYIWKKFKKYW